MTEESGKEEVSRGLFERIADAGEGAIQRVGEMPGVGKIAEPLLGLRERVDELSKRVRGLDALERRLSALEGRVTHLEGGPSTESTMSHGTEAAAPSVDLPMPPSGSPVTGVPADDPTGGTAGSEETSTSAQAP